MLLVILDIHCVSKKFPPLNSLQLCQILTDFQNFCTARPTANAGYSPPRRDSFPDYFGQTCYNRNQKWLQPVWHFEWDELGKLKGFLQLQQLITLQIAFWCLCIIRLICAPIKFTYLLTYKISWNSLDCFSCNTAENRWIDTGKNSTSLAQVITRRQYEHPCT